MNTLTKLFYILVVIISWIISTLYIYFLAIFFQPGDLRQIIGFVLIFVVISIIIFILHKF